MTLNGTEWLHFLIELKSEDDKKRGGWCESLYANIMIT